MEPPRVPQASDFSKRKAELEDSHKGDPEVPKMTPEELKEAEVGEGGGWVLGGGVRQAAPQGRWPRGQACGGRSRPRSCPLSLTPPPPNPPWRPARQTVFKDF